MLQHIGLMKVRPDAPGAEVRAVLEAIRDLPGKLEGLEAACAGPNVGPPAMGRGYTHGFVMSFRDEEAFRAFLDHPEHQAVVARLPGVLERSPDAALVFNVEV